MNRQTRAWVFDGAAGAIEAALDEPAAGLPWRGVAVIAHPHPLFGGTLHNKVVQTLARAFAQSGWRAVRFNFRGAGASAGVHDHGAGETQDFCDVVRQALALAPPAAQPETAGSPSEVQGGVPATAAAGPPALALAGFSFGAFVAASGLVSLWPGLAPRQVVLVGTAASRFAVPALPPEVHAHTLVLHGEHDDTVPLAAVLDWARPQSLPVTVVPGGEHFFHGQLPLLKQCVMRHLQA